VTNWLSAKANAAEQAAAVVNGETTMNEARQSGGMADAIGSEGE
jgi:hypothetical protein